jgi:hypothetical protein
MGGEVFVETTPASDEERRRRCRNKLVFNLENGEGRGGEGESLVQRKRGGFDDNFWGSLVICREFPNSLVLSYSY